MGEMMKRKMLAMLTAGTFACSSPLSLATDVWDLAVDGDNAYSDTDNVLWHTAPAQIHDLQGRAGGTLIDRDWFIVNPRARRSYEVQFLNVTGDADVWNDPPQRFASDGTTVLQTGTTLDANDWIVTMRWIQGAANDTNYIQVVGDSTSLTAAAQYSIQLRETTMYCARYNNTGTQTSVLIIQRTDPDNFNTCNYEARFNNEAGTEVGSATGALAAGNTMTVISTGGIAGVGATKGSAYIAHSCGYGGIAAKLVALEPSTGFSFDTTCNARPL
jgi:hypothetical protein